MMNLEIDPKKFYLAGMIAFFIVVFMNLLNLALYWGSYTIPNKISTFAMSAFYIVLIGFFHYFYKIEASGFQETDSSDDVEEILKRLEADGRI